ncbi:DnaD domain-containing protein [Chloroflexota bacterium]
MKLSEYLTDVGRPIAYHPKLKSITGSTNATIFFCQFFYWTGKEKSGDGWIYKSSVEIEEETGLSYNEQTTARKKLIDRGLLEEKYKRLEHQMYFKIDLERLDELWGYEKGQIHDSDNSHFGKSKISCSLISNTENTAKNTTETSTGTENGKIKSDSDLNDQHNSESLKKIFNLYENNIGLITPLIAQEIVDAIDHHPVEWIENAILLSVKANVRRWSYTSSILDRWKIEGYGSLPARNNKRKGKKGVDYGKSSEYSISDREIAAEINKRNQRCETKNE